MVRRSFAVQRSVVILLSLVLTVAVAIPAAVTPVAGQEVFELDVPFDDVAVGSATGEPLRLFIQNPRTDSVATFSEYELTGPDADEFRVVGLEEPVTVRGAEFHSFAVELRPTSPGPKSAELVVRGDSNDNRFTLHGVAHPADDTEPNDEIATATAVETTPIESIVVGNDLDVYAFDVAAGQTVEVTVENRGQGPVAYLVGAEGAGMLKPPTEVAGGSTATFTFEGDFPGTHTIGVANVFSGRTIETGQRYDTAVPYTVTILYTGGSSSPNGDAAVSNDDAADTQDGPEDSAGSSGDDAVSGSDGGDSASGQSGGESTGAAGPGFGVGVALVAVAAAALFLARRR